jgi:uncharacterized protein
MIHTNLQDFDMTTEANFVDLAFFTPAVKPMLHRLASSKDYTRTEGGSVKTQIGPKEAAFISGRDSFHLASIGQNSWPFTQYHRGPKGFLRMLDNRTLALGCFRSSRRHISSGAVLLFLIDHASRGRLKIWAETEISEDCALTEKLIGASDGTTIDRAFLFHIRAFEWSS